jgi:hypothetical protein
VARRLCEDGHIQVGELWSYHTVGDDVRFTLVQRSREGTPAAPRVRAAVAAARPARRKPATRAAKARPALKSKRAKKPARTQKRK